MVCFIFDDWKSFVVIGVVECECEMFVVFEYVLFDGYIVYYGVYWICVDQVFLVFGEVVFVVVSLVGCVLLIEQKVGFLCEMLKGFVKVYLQKECNVLIQFVCMQEMLYWCLMVVFGVGVYGVEVLLYCFDYVI